MAQRICQINGCERPHLARGWCSLHYQRWARYGDPVYQRYPKSCAVDGCRERVKAQGWCQSHYDRWRNHGDPLYERKPRVCDIEGCVRRHYARGWCGKHYHRWAVHGDPLWVPQSQADRFWEKVEKDGPVPVHAPQLGQCWVWTAYLNRAGYGTFYAAGRHMLAHRWLWIETNGPLPEDRPQLDHLCRNPACVRPSHLEPVTNKVNSGRGKHMRRFAERRAKAARLAARGMSRTEIAQRVGVSTRMVRHYLN